MRRALPLLIAAALQACATGGAGSGTSCTFDTAKNRAEFSAAARELDARTTRDKDGLHIRLNGEAGSVSSFAKGLIARESACCPFLRFRFEQTDEVNILHVSADNDHEGGLDRIHALLQITR